MAVPPLSAEFVAQMTAALQSLNVLPSADASNVSAIAAASVKLPPFWTEDVSAWFMRVEAMFRTSNISQDQTKFDYIVSSLDPRVVKEVLHVIKSPPAAEKYGTLKTALVKAFDKSQDQKDKELLSISGLGDLSPSAMLRRLQNLRSDDCKGECGFFKAHFMALLPPDVKAILATQKFETLEALATCADGIMEARDSASVSVVTGEDGAVAAIRAGKSGGSRRPNSGPPGSKVDKHLQKDYAKHVCRAHIRYGHKATSCQPWCLCYKTFTKDSSEN